MKVNGKTYFGKVLSPMLQNYLRKVSTHIYATVIYATVFLDDGWIKLDPSDDKKLCLNISYYSPTSILVEWDGRGHAELPLNEEDVYHVHWPVADITAYMEKPVKNAKFGVTIIGNHYVRFLRVNPVRISDPRELQPLFKKYLLKHAPVVYLVFQIYYLNFKIPGIIPGLKYQPPSDDAKQVKYLQKAI